MINYHRSLNRYDIWTELPVPLYEATEWLNRKPIRFLSDQELYEVENFEKDADPMTSSSSTSSSGSSLSSSASASAFTSSLMSSISSSALAGVPGINGNSKASAATTVATASSLLASSSSSSGGGEKRPRADETSAGTSQSKRARISGHVTADSSPTGESKDSKPGSDTNNTDGAEHRGSQQITMSADQLQSIISSAIASAGAGGMHSGGNGHDDDDNNYGFDNDTSAPVLKLVDSLKKFVVPSYQLPFPQVAGESPEAKTVRETAAKLWKPLTDAGLVLMDKKHVASTAAALGAGSWKQLGFSDLEKPQVYNNTDVKTKFQLNLKDLNPFKRAASYAILKGFPITLNCQDLVFRATLALVNKLHVAKQAESSISFDSIIADMEEKLLPLLLNCQLATRDEYMDTIFLLKNKNIPKFRPGEISSRNFKSSNEWLTQEATRQEAKISRDEQQVNRNARSSNQHRRFIGKPQVINHNHARSTAPSHRARGGYRGGHPHRGGFTGRGRGGRPVVPSSLSSSSSSSNKASF